MKLGKTLLLLLACTMAFTLEIQKGSPRGDSVVARGLNIGFVASAEARRARKKQRGRQPSNSGCRHWPQPTCAIKKYKTANGTPRANPRACAAVTQNNCFFVQGYRSCSTNSSLPGSARRSFHLCGCAVDLRPGNCKLDRGANLHGTGLHKHFVACSCPTSGGER